MAGAVHAHLPGRYEKREEQHPLLVCLPATAGAAAAALGSDAAALMLNAVAARSLPVLPGRPGKPAAPPERTSDRRQGSTAVARRCTTPETAPRHL